MTEPTPASLRGEITFEPWRTELGTIAGLPAADRHQPIGQLLDAIDEQLGRL